MGCRTIGITGGPTKIKLCRDEFGYDEAIDYKADNLSTALAVACPHGADVYFDNTAGDISDTVYAQLAIGARIVVCGTASISSWDPPPQGPRIERYLLVKRARMSGLLIFDYAHPILESESASRVHKNPLKIKVPGDNLGSYQKSGKWRREHHRQCYFSYIVGQPHRFKHLKRVLGDIVRRADQRVWFTTSGAIAAHAANMIGD